MANKTALIIIGIIAATAMGVGAFVGSELGGPAATPTATPTASGGDGAPAATPSPTATATATASPTPTVAPSEFNRTKIELAIQERVNAERRNRDLRSLARFDVAVEMARFHSANMATQGYPNHAAGGYTTAERYEKYGIHDRCKLIDDSETGIRSGTALETVQKTAVGRPVDVDGERRYFRNETAVANAVVDRWVGDDESREKLLYENANRVGIGVVVTNDGSTYVTLDLCG
jgi:uncharacterized protein YkwD